MVVANHIEASIKLIWEGKDLVQRRLRLLKIAESLKEEQTPSSGAFLLAFYPKCIRFWCKKKYSTFFLSVALKL